MPPPLNAALRTNRHGLTGVACSGEGAGHSELRTSEWQADAHYVEPPRPRLPPLRRGQHLHQGAPAYSTFIPCGDVQFRCSGGRSESPLWDAGCTVCSSCLLCGSPGWTASSSRAATLTLLLAARSSSSVFCIRTDAITWYAIRQVRNRASAGFAQWHPATAAAVVPV